jgi:hypothetical protein
MDDLWWERGVSRVNRGWVVVIYGPDGARVSSRNLGVGAKCSRPSRCANTKIPTFAEFQKVISVRKMVTEPSLMLGKCI